jgi:methionyl-tRNA formyltransferase
MGERASFSVVIFSVEPIPASRTVPLLTALGHRVVGIVTAPGPRSRRTERYREVLALARPGLDLIVCNAPERWAAMIAPLRSDLLITIGFNWVIPADVLAVPRLGAINLHDGLLPRYRGMNATGWALRNGESQIGFTIHRMTPRLDDGPILAQEALGLGDDDDIDTIRAWQMVAVPRLIEGALARLAAGEPGTPQCEEEMYSTPGRFEEAWRWIDRARPASTIARQVRSWVGTRDEPRGALGRLEGTLVRIDKVTTASDVAGHGAAPGMIVRQEGNTTGCAVWRGGVAPRRVPPGNDDMCRLRRDDMAAAIFAVVVEYDRDGWAAATALLHADHARCVAQSGYHRRLELRAGGRWSNADCYLYATPEAALAALDACPDRTTSTALLIGEGANPGMDEVLLLRWGCRERFTLAAPPTPLW